MKVGDKVRIVKSFTDEEFPDLGWFEEDMRKEIGRTGVITSSQYGGCTVDTGYKNTKWNWPKDCIEPVRNSIDECTPDEWTAASNRVMGYSKISEFPEKIGPVDTDIVDLQKSAMTQKQYELSVDNLLDKAADIAGNKRRNYAGDYDVTENFKRAAAQLGLTPEQALCIHLEKQMSAIYSYVKTGHESEPIETRLCDAINYIFLLNSLILQK